MENPRILFLHNKCMRYRIILFNMMAERLNIYFIFTDEREIKDLKANYGLLNKYGWGRFRLTRGLISVLIRERYDLIVFPPADLPGEIFDNLICFIAAKIKRKPYLIWSEKWRWKEDKKSLIRRFYLALDQFVMGSVFRSAAACISDGTKHKEYLLSLNVSEKKIFVAPPASVLGRDSDSNDMEGTEDDLGLVPQKKILYVGRLLKRKGVNYLIEAFAKAKKEIDSVRLLIIGGEGLYGRTGEDRFSIDQLKKQSESLGLKLDHDIFFLGDVGDNTLLRSYQECNVFVLPAIFYLTGEPWGLVLNEAMQFEKPVISTDAVGAAYDLIEEGINGFMVHEKDVEALNKALIIILSNEEVEKEMGKESKRIISRYNYENMFDGFAKAINFALN